ncbi:chaperonin 60B2 [Scenedesmus sp. NREL 46B-D3]|nr:chaperonin 60B2 [Scenedesmus sp. NREL 46B-D3]
MEMFYRRTHVVRAAKDLHFNKNMEALKKMQAGADKLATVVGVTLGPKGRNVVLESKYGSPKIVNDGVTIAKEVELEDPVENIGAKLVRQAAARTNDTAGDGTTTATILSAAFIAEGLKIVAAGTNPVQLTRGMDKTVAALVKELAKLSTEVASDKDLANVASVSAGGNAEIGQLIADAMAKVGRQGVVTMEESKTADDNLFFVEGMQFDRGYYSPYFVTDPERMVAEYENCRILLVDKKISTARDVIGLLEAAIRGNYPLLIMAEDVEQEALATLVVNKLRGTLKVVAVKAPGFGERKTSYLEDIAILTGGTMVKEELGMTLDKADESVLGVAAKVVISKESCTIVGDGRTQGDVDTRVKQIRNLAEQTEQEYEKEKLNERIARLSGGVAIIQVGAQTETELKEKKLRVEDALNATKAAVEEGIVIGGGCTLLKLAAKVDMVKESLSNEEQKVGAEIVKKALTYPLKLIAENAGTNGSVVMQRVIDSQDPNYGYNAAVDRFEDLMQTGIIDPTKVIRCALENACSVAKIFLLADVVVTEIPEKNPAAAAAGGGADEYGY